MTAVKWLQDKWSNCKEWKWEEIQQWFEQAKEMEKQQIIDSFEIGKSNGYELGRYNNDCEIDNGIEYYNETYGSKGSDETLKEYHIVDINEMVSSQTEISVDEIDKAAKQYYDENIDYSSIPRERYEWEIQELMSDFCYKWYREQLKKKQ